MIRNKGIPREKIAFRRGKGKNDESSNAGSEAEAREARAASREERAREVEAREAENRAAMTREARAHAREARASEASEVENHEERTREVDETCEVEARDERAHEARLREAKARAEACREETVEEDDVSEDDCSVVGDDDCDGIEDGADEEDEDDQEHDEEEEDVEDEIDEENVDEEAARDEGDESDADSGDDVWDNEKIPDPLSSDDDEDEEEQISSDHEDPDKLLALGKTFNSAEDFKLAVLRYSLKTRYGIKLYRSQAMRIGAKCSDTDVPCGWRIYCFYEKRKHKMQVKIYINEHTCVRSGYSKMLKRSTIAWLFVERLRLNPKLTKQEIASEILREYNLVVSDEQCGKAKTKVVRERKASHEAHFARIWDYQAEVLQTNKGTKFEIETISGPTVGSKQRFYRLFICFNSQREFWKQTCRPIIGLDGAFLKLDIKGHLLAAVGRDEDNRIVPIAWAVVEIESDDNWDWFVKRLSNTLGLDDGRNVAIISDKQKGLVKAIHNVLPSAEGRT
ncbi:PREDICTED: transcription elongation factor SPT5-like [Brassica oleracea var. oleracea]|uniref:transcription elongation factor SPT5-like n=1 Tax=Brassica oleracea var. oleracea TaxID=109376 RepID=UPI0006A7149F|nr:PREDICTED: transcription elongation factor SPT5-like [Brassica oleracea var. oleracea]